jgi:hypothetical protein
MLEFVRRIRPWGAVTILAAVSIVLLAGCVAPPAAPTSDGLVALSDLPPLPEPEALRGIGEGPFIIGPPRADRDEQARAALMEGAEGYPPGRLAAGRPVTLRINPAVPTPDERMPIPPSSPPEIPAKPLLELPPPPRFN